MLSLCTNTGRRFCAGIGDFVHWGWRDWAWGGCGYGHGGLCCTLYAKMKIILNIIIRIFLFTGPTTLVSIRVSLDKLWMNDHGSFALFEGVSIKYLTSAHAKKHTITFSLYGSHTKIRRDHSEVSLEIPPR